MDLMIDLETLGTNPDCPVISIGAVFFDKTGLKSEFYINLDVDKQINDGRRMTADTFKWWMSQTDGAKRVFKEKPTTVSKGLSEFVEFVKKGASVKRVKPWGNGSTFDISILEDLFEEYEIKVPWLFYNIRDMRTFKEYVYDGKDMKFEGTAHNALDDAKQQANVVIEGLKRTK